MVLIDSSVWIQFYNQKASNTPKFDNIVALGQAATTDLIMTEVLQGFRLSDKKRYMTALSDLESCIHIPSFNKTIAINAATNYRRLRSMGITPRNTIDVYLATLCIQNKIAILTYDLGDFRPMQEALGLQMIETAI